MPTVHFLNVREGDCSIIQHGSGRVSIIDICNGQTSARKAVKATFESLLASYAETANRATKAASGNYGMKDSPTDPIAYLKALGISNAFRFILTHPDMDHLDGFKALCDEIGIANYWDAGTRKTKPDFSGGRYDEADWDHYVKVRDGNGGATVVTPKAGSQFQFANLGDPDNHGDCLSIVSPNTDLVNAANEADDPNDASYVVVYRTAGGKIIFPGDAHDKTWEYVLANHTDLVKDCAVLIACHHGRSSDRCHDFLDTLKPKLSLFGCADSDHLAYDAWNSRDLFHITNNQAGNVILDAASTGIHVYVENQKFAETFTTHDLTKTLHGCFYIGQVLKP